MSFSVSLVRGINWYGINRDFVEELMEKQSATSAVGDKEAVVILLYKEKKLLNLSYLYLYIEREILNIYMNTSIYIERSPQYLYVYIERSSQYLYVYIERNPQYLYEYIERNPQY